MCVCENLYSRPGLFKLLEDGGGGVAGRQGNLIDRTGWILPLVITNRADFSRCLERNKDGKREGQQWMLGGREGREGWADRPRLIANITSPPGATTAAMLIFLPLSHLYSFYSPVSLSRSPSGHLCLLASPVVCLFLLLSSLPSLLFCHVFLFRIYIYSPA